MTDDTDQSALTTDDAYAQQQTTRTTWWTTAVAVVFVVIGTLTVGGWWLTTPPAEFPEPASLEVTPGMGASAIAEAAAAAHLVRSSSLLYLVIATQHDPTNIFAGRYVFPEPESVFAVADRLASQQTEEELISVTFPEGITAERMGEIAANALPSVDETSYQSLATPLEGTLFPETYFVPSDFTAEELIELQQLTFEEQVAPGFSESTSSTLSADDVITLASIVEREANDETSMKMVAGIFLNRLSIGMALQADASIEYVLDTPLHELPPGQLATELRQTDSPYNTYLYPGLPPTPIGNPGLQAITAVLNPTPSDYFYYITGNDGEFYYAATLQEHNVNIARHLR